MKAPSKLLISVALISLCYVRCKHACKHNTETYYLTQYDKDRVAYNGTEVLTFVRIGINDTVTFRGQGLAKDFSSHSTQEDCYNLISLEENHIDFTAAGV